MSGEEIVAAIGIVCMSVVLAATVIAGGSTPRPPTERRRERPQVPLWTYRETRPAPKKETDDDR